MPVVFACIAPHGGHLLLDKNAPTPVPKSRAAMETLHSQMLAARPEAIALITPHGVVVEGAMSLGVTPRGFGELDGLTIGTETDLDLAAAWAYHASVRGVRVAPLMTQEEEGALPLDWGVTIPLALLLPGLNPMPPAVIACPDRNGLTRPQLMMWGEALVIAADELDKRVALIVSADQGHGHAANGPYGFTPVSAEYDAAMQAAIEADDLMRLLSWPEDFAETALADSYWQTLALIGVQKRVSLRAQFLSYEVDHYFGLLCAAFSP